MRINPDLTADLLTALSRTQQDQQDAILQLATGKRVNRPSDDPQAAAELILNHNLSAQNNQYTQNISSLQALLQTADSTLSSCVESLNRAISLGVEAANGTVSDSDRQSLVQEVTGIQQQLMSQANLSFQGTYVFAGTANQDPPFVADPTSPSGVKYIGNSGVNTVAIGEGLQVAANVPGDQLFGAHGADVFQAMQNLITALKNNEGIDTAVQGLRTAFDNLTAQRVFYGNTLSQLSSQQVFLQNQQLQLSTQENDLVGIDPAVAASRVVTSKEARDATLAAIGQMSKLNLFDYLT